MFKGSIVALVTPFAGETLAEDKLRDLVRFQIENGTSGIVPCGTTGESPTLSHEEHERVIENCVEAADKKVPVIAGTGSNSTREAVNFTEHAARVGAAGALVVTPYYNKPTQEGLYRHFKAVSECADIPIILYNIAGRTARNIEPETMARLAKDCKNIIGVKEASGSLEQMMRIRHLCGEDFVMLSGDDMLTLPLMSIGGKGVISVAANLVPKDVAALAAACGDGDFEKARQIHFKLMPLIKALFLETNPTPVKTAAGLMGLCAPDLRLPLCEMNAENLAKLKSVLKDYGLIKEERFHSQGAGK